MTRNTHGPRPNLARLLAQLAGKDRTYGRRSAAVVIAAALIVGFIGLDGAASTAGGDGSGQSGRDQAKVRQAMSSRTVESVGQGKRLAAAAGLRGHTLTFITHVIPGHDVFVDVPPTDVSPGDIFVGEAEVFNASHSRRIGEAILRCDLNIATITCNHAISLDGRGKLLISKPFIGNEMGAITGGTGDFKHASGQGTWFDLNAPDFDMMFVVELRH